MTVPLTVDLDEAVVAELDALATRTSRSRERLLADALEHFLAAQSWQVSRIEAGLAAADADDFASDEDVARVAERFRRAASKLVAMRLRWTRTALADLESIGEFVAGESPRAAAAIVDRILDRTAALTLHPGLGRQGRVEGTRELVVSGTPFVVPYRIRDQSIEILAVFHAARRWPEQF